MTNAAYLSRRYLKKNIEFTPITLVKQKCVYETATFLMGFDGDWMGANPPAHNAQT